MRTSILYVSVLDDVFGRKNFCSAYHNCKRPRVQQSDLMPGIADYLVWYAKDKDQVKYRQLYTPQRSWRRVTVNIDYLHAARWHIAEQ